MLAATTIRSPYVCHKFPQPPIFSLFHSPVQSSLSHSLSHFSVTNFWLWRDTQDTAIIKAVEGLAIDSQLRQASKLIFYENKTPSKAVASAFATAYWRLVMSPTKDWKSRFARLGEQVNRQEAVVREPGTVSWSRVQISTSDSEWGLCQAWWNRSRFYCMCC